MADSITDTDMAPGYKQAVTTTQTSAGPTVAITVTTQAVHILTLTGNHTSSTISNGTVTGQQLRLQIYQDGTGSRTFVWPTANIVWPVQSNTNGIAPLVAAVPASKGLNVTLIWDGTNWIESGRGGSLVSMYSARGDLLIGTANAGQPGKVSAGAFGTIMTYSDQGAGLFNGMEARRHPIGASGLGPTSTKAETMPRSQATANTVVGPATGVLRLIAIYLQEGQVYSALNFYAGATAGATLTHSNAALYTSALAQVAVGSDNTTAAWALNTKRTFTFTAAYTPTAAGLYYAGIVLTGTTMPTFYGTIAANAALNAEATIATGDSTTGLTTAVPPATAGALTAVVGNIHAWVT